MDSYSLLLKKVLEVASPSVITETCEDLRYCNEQLAGFPLYLDTEILEVPDDFESWNPMSQALDCLEQAKHSDDADEVRELMSVVALLVHSDFLKLHDIMAPATNAGLKANANRISMQVKRSLKKASETWEICEVLERLKQDGLSSESAVRRTEKQLGISRSRVYRAKKGERVHSERQEVLGPLLGYVINLRLHLLAMVDEKDVVSATDTLESFRDFEEWFTRKESLLSKKTVRLARSVQESAPLAITGDDSSGLAEIAAETLSLGCHIKHELSEMLGPEVIEDSMTDRGLNALLARDSGD